MSAATRKKLRVTVLAGGPSAEREISLASGGAIADALRQRGHEVFVADVGPDNLAALDHPADVVFPALHGTFGEDGTIQRIMEQRGIRFVGSGSQASALAMDKVAAKRVAESLGIPTPAYEVVTPLDKPLLPLPVVVKPIAEGSSVGTTVVREPGKLQRSVESVAGKYGRALVERFIAGDELTVGLLGEQTLPPICIRPRRDFYDFEAKYHDDHTEYLFNAGHPRTLLERASTLSRRVCAALGCRHLARIDWIAGPGEGLWFLEVNTIPGFTSHSLVPKAAAHVGIPFDELVERLVRMAIEEAR
ncbi:MAG: D-alanine--D-alanine ligase [Phycisphaerae bacterium]